MSAPLLGMGLGLLIFASWSDSVGRCKILLGGTAIGLIISLALPLVHNYPLFLSFRFLQGMFLSVCPALAVPLLGEELRKSWLPSAVGYYVASNTIGGISSRLLGGISSEYLNGWANAGFVISGISLLLFVIIYLLLPPQKHFKAQPFKLGQCIKAYGQHLKKPQLVMLYLLIGLAFGTFVNLSSYLMIVLGDFPYNLPSDIRSLMFLTLLGGTTSSLFAGKFAKKHSQISGVVMGIRIMLVANFIMSWSNLYTMIVGMIMVSIGFFFVHAQASTLIGKSVTKAKGSAQGLYSLFYYSGASLGVFYLEPFYQYWGWQGILGATRVALGACILLTVLYQWVGSYSNHRSHALS